MYFTMNQNSFVLFLALSCHISLISSQDNNNNNNKNNKNIERTDSQDGVNHTSLPQARLEDVRMFSKYDYKERGRLIVDFKNVTTSSIHVNWSLPEMKFNDSVLESSVVCETSNGLLIFKKHVSSRAAYHLENLHANTSYFVCVYMLEKSQSSNTKVLHYSCKLLETKAYILIPSIPSMRTDSIVAVVLTLGYITAMIIIGYVTWRWKRKLKEQDEAKQRLAIEEEYYDEEEGMLNGGLRDNNPSRGAGNSSHSSNRGINSPSFGYSASVDDVGNRTGKDVMRNSNRGLDSSDRVRGGSKGNNVGSVGFTESDVVVERKSSSMDEVNGCLDFKRNSRGSAVKLTDLAENGNSQEKRQIKSQTVDDSPVKVTEISF